MKMVMFMVMVMFMESSDLGKRPKVPRLEI
jgi:hypothetical protein